MHKAHSHSHKSEEKKSQDWFALALILGYVLVFVYLGWMFVKTQRLYTEMDLTEASIENLEKLMSEDENRYNFNSASAVRQAQAHQVKWSEAMSQVVALETQSIQFTSFSVSRNREVDIQGVARDISAVRKLLRDLEENKEVQDPFISTIGANGNSGSRFENTFTLSFSFASPKQ